MENTKQNLDLLRYIDPHPETNYFPNKKLFVETQNFLGLSDAMIMSFFVGLTVQKVYYYISVNNELICEHTRPKITPNEKNFLNDCVQSVDIKQFQPINNNYNPMLTNNIDNAKKVWQTTTIVFPESVVVKNFARTSFKDKEQFLNSMLQIRNRWKNNFLHHIATLMDIKSHLPLNDMLKTYHDKKYEDIIPFVEPRSFVKKIHYTTNLKEWLCPKCKYFVGVFQEVHESIKIGEYKKYTYSSRHAEKIEYIYRHTYDITFINNPNIKFASEEEKNFYTIATTYHLQAITGNEKFEFGKKYFQEDETNLSAFEFGIDRTHYNFKNCLHKTDYYLSLNNVGNDFETITGHIKDHVYTTGIIGGVTATLTHSTIGIGAAQATLTALPAVAATSFTTNTALAVTAAFNMTTIFTPVGLGVVSVLACASAIKILPTVANTAINISQEIVSSNAAQLTIQKIKQATPWFGNKKANLILHEECTKIKEYLDIKMACLIENGKVNCVTDQEFVEIFFSDDWQTNLQFYNQVTNKSEFKDLASRYQDKIIVHTQDDFGVLYK